jgi:hypothetical protein
MTNNTEQRRAFEEWFYDLFPMGIDDKTEALMLKSWQAALAQREQVEELPLIRVTERYDEGWRVNGKWFDHQPTEAEVNEAYAAPSPSLCTAEEAEELMKCCTDYKVTDCCFSLSGRELAEIINADRAKR